jgi:predicted signal transduction protein with EAL and GGDEF domain
MAKGLKKLVVAEGVETGEQLTLLRARGCDEAQGHYFSKPLAAKDFARILVAGLDSSVTSGTTKVNAHMESTSLLKPLTNLVPLPLPLDRCKHE